MSRLTEPMPMIGIVVLGCDKNTADAEHFAGTLAARFGGRVQILSVTTPGECPDRLDAVIIFTCAFIHDAKVESIETILDWTASKQVQSTPRHVYVAGCLSERYQEALEAEIPEADGVVGIADLDALIDRLCPSPTPDRDTGSCHIPLRYRLDDKPYAYLKIADGCDRACTFCVIPDIKGPFISVPREDLLADAAALVDAGVREINLVAQDITEYGRDLYKDYGLASLLADLCALPGEFWIRCLYCYPSGITDALVRQIATQPKIVPYLDIPLQHVSRSMLTAMGRPEKDLDLAALTRRLRAEIPGLVLRTTMMTGFPGETEADHRAMLEFIREQAFEWLGAFTYSPEEGSPAARLGGQVDSEVARQRYDAVMQTQMDITEAFNQKREGTEVLVLLEGYDPELGAWRGRSPAEAPEVDGMVVIEDTGPLTPGTFVKVQFTRADLYDLYAKVLEQPPSSAGW